MATLCKICEVYFSEANLKSRALLRQFEPHHRSVESFKSAAQEACYVCKIVWSSTSLAEFLPFSNYSPFVGTLVYACENVVEVSVRTTGKSYFVNFIREAEKGHGVASRRFFIAPSLGACPCSILI
jgi:hypothetical protein